MATNMAELIELRELNPFQYESRRPPEQMGNSKAIAYGGCTLAIAVNAAYKSLSSPAYGMYSAQGSFLGPALTDRLFQCTVEAIRDTKTFATRIVRVRQRQDDGQDRVCLIMLADFQKAEEASILEYSRPPARAYTTVSKCVPVAESKQRMVDAGTIPASLSKLHGKVFGLMGRFIEQRSIPEGVATQNLLGMNKTLRTTQDELPLHEKTSAEWNRVREEMKTPAEHVAALAL